MGYPRVLGRALLAVACVANVVLVASCAEQPLSPGSDVEAAEQAISAWVAANPAQWAAAAETRVAPTRPAWTPACADPASNGYVSLRLVTRRGDIELAFRCPLDEHATIQDLQEHFVHAVPWNLPTGIASPNWRFQAWLPLSSIYNGVTFHTPQPGLLAVDIESTMLGIRAENTRRGCAPIADGLSSCLIERDHRVPLRMRFTVLSDLTALR